MALTQWQLKPVATDTIASGDFVAFTDENESGDPINKLTVDNLMETGLPLVTEDSIADGDYILFLDGGATGNTNKEAVHDLATLFAGTGLTATSSVIAVDAAQTGITSLGTQAANFAVGNGYGVIIGNATQETISIGDGATDLVPELQVLGTAAADSSMLLAAFSTTATTAGSPILAFAKGGNGTLGSHTVVTDGEELGNIIAFGDDGTDLETPAASIQFEVDGTPGSGDMPGRIILGTTADGATAVTEAVRIDALQQSTFAGTIIPGKDIKLNTTPADESVSGVTATFTAGETLVRGEVVYFKASDTKMWKAVATAAGTSRCVAMAAEDISADANGLFLLQGFCADNGTFPSYTIGGTLYTPEAETSGENVPEQTAPDTDGDFVQVIGWAFTASCVYFNPSNDIIEHA